MNELLFKIEYELYWIKYLQWVYNESPDDEKPESPLKRLIDGI